MTLVGNWNYPTSIKFGPGRVKETAQGCRDLGMARPLVVTDPGVAKLPWFDAMVADLRAAGLGVGVFSDVHPNPTGADVEAGLAVLRAGNHDGVVAVGGGSGLDAAKAIALMARQTRPLWDFEDVGDWWTRVDVDAMVPVVAVPTTSGTGSEVGRASVITDESVHVKKIIFHPRMLPGRVIADPELTVGLPPHLTAATGIDALSHSLEAWCAPGFHPLAEGVAMEGIRLVDRALLRAYRDGTDIEARAWMLAASIHGATAFQKGLGAMHGIAHVVGAHTNAHHGLLNAIVMPYVLVFNRPAVEAKLADLDRALGRKGTFSSFVDWVLDLRAATNIPNTLDAVGVTEDKVDAWAAASVQDAATGGNPVPMDAAGYARIYRAALRGDLAG